MRNYCLNTLLFFGLLLLVSPVHAQKGWISLFDGKSLDGWKVVFGRGWGD
jgi:hypothetical protein